MFDSIKHFEDAKKEKAVDDPSVRWRDPACWKCLSDEQRDTINEWHLQLLLEQEQERQAETAKNTWAAILGLIPLAFLYAAKDSLALSIPKFLLNFVVALVVFSVIFFLFAGAYLSARKAKPLTMDKFDYVWFHLTTVVAALFVTCFILGRVI